MDRRAAVNTSAARYLHGGVVIVPAEVAAWLLANGDLNRLRVATRGADPRRDAVLMALAMAAHQHMTVTSGDGCRSAMEPEAAAPLEWMSTTQAADQLGVTDRAVRLACQLGRLAARQVGGRWQVSRAVLDEYQRGKGGT